uniref:Uncharacterized protein n=1 Tax=Chromera velia CCMP2878 TaxID=1169474 RepID=A0A0G4I4C0_9ALVE|eukprot:Cvel_10886.t1-p1 / transcript=Cvel_10886.t1 / gene=Cvel_10886 / organism=Chromera_velia_CCMP2878 / gene_product=hypothetical protein / transcript_product=hypothetical protein / location=Cvel_scaffold667:48258-54733(+) / protein_length=680 / sequence_SO=supercontig / SO=protein_coding / is_pseudo=false
MFNVRSKNINQQFSLFREGQLREGITSDPIPAGTSIPSEAAAKAALQSLITAQRIPQKEAEFGIKVAVAFANIVTKNWSDLESSSFTTQHMLSEALAQARKADNETANPSTRNFRASRSTHAPLHLQGEEEEKEESDVGAGSTQTRAPVPRVVQGVALLNNELGELMSEGRALGDPDCYKWRLFLRTGDFEKGCRLSEQLRQLDKGYGYSFIEAILDFNFHLHPFYPPQLTVVRPELVFNDSLEGLDALQALACLPILRFENWKPTTTVRTIMKEIAGTLEKYFHVDVSAERNDRTRFADGVAHPLRHLLGHLSWTSCSPLPSYERLYEPFASDQPSPNGPQSLKLEAARPSTMVFESARNSHIIGQIHKICDCLQAFETGWAQKQSCVHMPSSMHPSREDMGVKVIQALIDAESDEKMKDFLSEFLPNEGGEEEGEEAEEESCEKDGEGISEMSPPEAFSLSVPPREDVVQWLAHSCLSVLFVREFKKSFTEVLKTVEFNAALVSLLEQCFRVDESVFSQFHNADAFIDALQNLVEGSKEYLGTMVDLAEEPEQKMPKGVSAPIVSSHDAASASSSASQGRIRAREVAVEDVEAEREAKNTQRARQLAAQIVQITPSIMERTKQLIPVQADLEGAHNRKRDRKTSLQRESRLAALQEGSRTEANTTENRETDAEREGGK